MTSLFCAVKEDRAKAEGIENPLFNIISTDISNYQSSGEKNIRCDKLDSTLVTHQKKLTQQAHAEPRGYRTYRHSSVKVEMNPEHYNMDTNKQEEIELVPLKLKEKILHDELIHLLDGDESDSGDLQGKTRLVSTLTSTSVQTDAYSGVGDDFLPKDEAIPCYIEEFERDAQDDIIMLGSLSQEQDFKCQEGFIQSGRKILYRRSDHSFKKTESQLFNAANAHKEEILAKLGNISKVNNESNGAAGLCWKGNWTDRPQPIQILLKCLRGVKDKIPKGHYVMKTSLLSRPGGHALQWSKVKDHLWAETTLPVYHRGQFHDVEITVHHAVHTLLPTEKKIKSGMTLLLELYLLHGKDTYIDRAVGWGIFPLCDNNLNVLEGKYRCPLLRGHYDSRIDRFNKVEDLIATDLDHWLCNLYFQIIKLPLFINEQKEFDIFVQLPQEFLTYASYNEKKPDNENGIQSHLRRDNCKQSCHYQGTHSSIHFTYSQGQPLASKREPNVHKELLPSTAKDIETHLNAVKGKERNILNEAQAKLQQTSLTQEVQVEETSETNTIRRIRRKMLKKGITRNKIVPYTDKQLNVVTSKEDFDFNKKKEEKDPPKHRFQWTQKVETVSEKQIEKCSTATSYLDELEKHRYSVCTKPRKEMHAYQRIAKHTTFVIWAVFSELDLGQWKSRDFWLIMFMMALMWFMRLYLHYCSQWLFLQAISIPVLKFAFYPHTVELTYQNSLMHTGEEVFMVVVGPMSLNISMFAMIFLRWSCQVLFHSLPTILSKFIIALGLWTVLDPLAVFIVDAFLGRLSYSAEKPIADAAKLYWHFFRAEQSGTPGILITLLIYTMIFIISSSVLYLFLLRIHKEGWILDVFQRISCEEAICPVPYDLEISNQELSQIVRKAEQWRGINGERRKIAVYDYIWKKEVTNKSSISSSDVQHLEPHDSSNYGDGSKDITTHVLIYTIHLKGFRELYRQFLRLPDGAIVEIFGDFSGVNLLPSEVSNAADEHANPIFSLSCDAATAMDLRERKKCTASY
ncbi:uncharacterized protein [Pyxicephalus adspersus]|uniref:uncharacterized protein n=1 Tax=Pyxicephalus adspersus TaxID=30357 RepID=UPI003B5B5E3A